MPGVSYPHKAFRWMISSTALHLYAHATCPCLPKWQVLSRERCGFPQAAPGSSDCRAVAAGPTAAHCVSSMCDGFVTWTAAYLLQAPRSCPNHRSLESDRAAPSQDLRLVQTSRRENTNLFLPNKPSSTSRPWEYIHNPIILTVVPKSDSFTVFQLALV